MKYHYDNPEGDEEAPLVPPTPVAYPTESINGTDVVINQFTSRPIFEDDPAFIEAMTGKVNETATESSRNPLFDQAYRLAILGNFSFLLFLALFALFLGSIVHFYEHPETRGKYIVLVILIGSVLGTTFGLLFRWALPPNLMFLTRSMFVEISACAASLLAGVAFYLYLNGTLTAQTMAYFFLVPVTLSFVDLFLARRSLAIGAMPNALGVFITALQNLIFVLNIAYFHIDEWSLVLVVYLIAAIVFMVYSALVTVATCGLFVAWIVRFAAMFQDVLISAFILSFLVFLSGIGFLWFFLFLGFRRLLERHSIFVEHPQTEHMDQYLLSTAISGLAFVAFIFLWNLILFYPVSKKYRANFMNKVVHKREVFYKQKLLMKVALVSTNYFKKSEDLPAGTPTESLGKCFVCLTRDANCLIYPCGHTGMCLDCLHEDQARRNKCMSCKGAVLKVKKVRWDEEDGVYYSTLEETYPQ